MPPVGYLGIHPPTEVPSILLCVMLPWPCGLEPRVPARYWQYARTQVPSGTSHLSPEASQPSKRCAW